MTPQEQQMIDELVDRIRSTNVQDKDIAAEQHLQQGLAGTPDAVYILAQTVIVQKYGLEQAQQRLQTQQSELDSLREQAAQAQTQVSKPSGGSFLSHIFGGDSQQNQPQAPPPQQGWQQVNGPAYGQPGYPPPGYGQQGYPPPPNYQPGYGQPSGWGSAPTGSGGGFLRGAMQTAAGVAAGAVAFEGIESLFHGFGGGGGFGGRGFEGGRPSETIINNYNDDGPRRDSDERSDRNDRDDSSFYNPHDDASRGGEERGFADNDKDDNNNNDSDNDEDNSNDSSDFNSSDDSDDSSGGDDSN